MSLEFKLIALLAIVLSFAGLGLWGQQQHLAAVKAKDRVEALTTIAKGLQSALDESVKDGTRKDAVNLAKQRKINQLTVEGAKTQKALNEALKANRTWADAPVPDGVWDAIAPTPSGEAKARPGVDGASPGPAKAGQ